MFVVGQGKAGMRGEENPALPVRGKRGVGHLARFHAITVAGMRRDNYSSAFMRRLVISRTAARMTRMEPPTYRMVVPLPPVEWGQKASPLGVRSHALGRKLSAKQTGRRPSVSVRGPLTLASRLYRGRGAGRSVWGGPHPSCRFAAIHLPHRGKA